MEIFEATKFDITELAVLFDHYRQFYNQPADVKAATRFLKERIDNRDSIIYIAQGEAGLSGFVQLYPIFSSVRMKNMWLLNDLYVLPAERKKGIAKLLIARCKELVSETGACGLLLETGKDNKEGNQLYPSENFKLADTNFYYWINA